MGKILNGKFFGMLFLLAGLVFMLWQDTITGNAVGYSVTTLNIAFYLSLGLMVLGGVLLYLSLKKKN